MPFELRSIREASASDLVDAITPYGYGGAFVNGEVDPDGFWRAWTRWAQRNGVVSLTVRSHLLPGVTVPLDADEVSPFDNVVVDVSQPHDDLWQSLAGRVRTDVRRADREGVTVEFDQACERLEEFHQIYTRTMEAHQADDYYLFDLQSLQQLVEALGTRIMLAHAFHDGRMVASEMNLLGDGVAYYFLSGATDQARSARANPKMKVEIMRWLHDRGYSSYLLGGGMARDDSLFRYKLGYAPNGRVPFVIRYLETLPEDAARLEAQRRNREPGWNPKPDYLPPYRSPAAKSHEAQNA